jgi:hypothetical protein
MSPRYVVPLGWCVGECYALWDGVVVAAGDEGGEGMIAAMGYTQLEGRPRRRKLRYRKRF